MKGFLTERNSLNSLDIGMRMSTTMHEKKVYLVETSRKLVISTYLFDRMSTEKSTDFASGKSLLAKGSEEEELPLTGSGPWREM